MVTQVDWCQAALTLKHEDAKFVLDPLLDIRSQWKSFSYGVMCSAFIAEQTMQPGCCIDDRLKPVPEVRWETGQPGAALP